MPNFNVNKRTYEERFVKLGNVSNLLVTEVSGRPDILQLGFRTSHAGYLRFYITQSAARILWFNLTQFLFPRAADQLTQRASTAALSPTSSPSIVFAVKAWRDEKTGLIHTMGVNAVQGWHMRFTAKDGEELWASLEHVLRAN